MNLMRKEQKKGWMRLVKKLPWKPRCRTNGSNEFEKDDTSQLADKRCHEEDN